MRDQPPFLLDALLHEERHFPTLLEARLGFTCLALGLHIILHGLRHAVERRAYRMRFRSGEWGQAERKLATLNTLQSVCNDRKRRERTINRPESKPIDDDQHDRPDNEQPSDVIPCVENGPWRLGFDHQLHAPWQRKGVPGSLRG